MFTGHFAAALAGGSASRRTGMGVLIVAAFGADIFEGVVAAVNVPDVTRVWSHSVPATAAIGIVCAVFALLRGASVRDCVVILFVAMSHTLLDFVTGRKTVWPGVRPMGFDLYNRPVLETAVEVVCIVIGWLVWRRSLQTQRRAAPATWAMLALLIGAQAAAAISIRAFGPLTSPDAMSKFVR